MASFTSEEVYVLARAFSQTIDVVLQSANLREHINILQKTIESNPPSNPHYPSWVIGLDNAKEKLHNYEAAQKILQRFAVPEAPNNWNPPFVTGGRRTRKHKRTQSRK
jgi:hypothetical protein